MHKSSTPFLLHLECAIDSMGKIWRTPFQSALTILVLGMVLALPSDIIILSKNLIGFGKSLHSGTHIQVFLDREIKPVTLDLMKVRLKSHKDVSRIMFTSKENALETFKQGSGLSEAIQILNENPFPDIITVYPKERFLNASDAQSLNKFIKETPGVDMTELDTEWVEKLHVLMQFLKRALFSTSALLGVAVLLIVGNTIRLQIKSEQRNIQIYKLLGATDKYIQRPFLYLGSWYGFWGGIAAWGLVSFSLVWLNEPLGALTKLFNNQFTPLVINLLTTVLLLIFGILLGLVGAYINVKQYLRTCKA